MFYDRKLILMILLLISIYLSTPLFSEINFAQIYYSPSISINGDVIAFSCFSNAMSEPNKYWHPYIYKTNRLYRLDDNTNNYSSINTYISEVQISPDGTHVFFNEYANTVQNCYSYNINSHRLSFLQNKCMINNRRIIIGDTFIPLIYSIHHNNYVVFHNNNVSHSKSNSFMNGSYISIVNMDTDKIIFDKCIPFLINIVAVSPDGDIIYYIANSFNNSIILYKYNRKTNNIKSIVPIVKNKMLLLKSGIDNINVSNNGRYITFNAFAENLLTKETHRQVFIYDVRYKSTKLISIGTDNMQANDDSGSVNINISADGRYICYDSSATNIVKNNYVDYGIYIYDTKTGITKFVSYDQFGKPIYNKENKILNIRFAMSKNAKELLYIVNNNIYMRNLKTAESILLSDSRIMF